MAPRTSSPLLALFFLFSSTLVASQTLTISTRLIHRDSYLSPLHNALETVAERAERSLQSSLARHASIPPLIDESNNRQKRGLELGVVEAMKRNIFLVNFSIGSLPVPQMAVMDTSTDLLWVRCLPCSPCSPVAGTTVYDPAKSTTFIQRPCTAKGCTNDCNASPGTCNYTIPYDDGERNQGILARERLTFDPLDFGAPNNFIVPNQLFGCMKLVTGPDDPDQHLINGVLALGSNAKNTLIARFGRRFSYCVGNTVDPFYAYNRLFMGVDAHLGGDSTTLMASEHGGVYFASIASITFDGQVLDIPKEVIATMSHQYGVNIESGTELSFLYTEAFDVLKAAVSKAANSTMNVEVTPIDPYELCFKGTVEADAARFPKIGLQFEEGPMLVPNQFGAFIQVEDDVFCLAFIRAPDVSVVGLLVQQGYSVGYDLVAGRLFFEPIDCSVLG